MATQLSHSPPDAMPANPHTPRDGLGYSRHYAKRIRDTAKSLPRNQMFPRKMATQTIRKKEAGMRPAGVGKEDEPYLLPLWDSASSDKPKTLAVELANSPYMATLMKPNYTFVKTRVSPPVAVRGSDAKDVPVSVEVPSWRTRDSRAVYIIRLQNWANATVEKALTVSYFY